MTRAGITSNGLIDGEWLINQVAHALRNPIFAAMMQAESLMLRAERSGGDDRFAASVAQQLDRLEAVIQEMLLYGRPASIAPRACQLHQITDPLPQPYATGQRGAPAELEVVLNGPETDGTWDPDGVRTILMRLLDNAVQHSAEPRSIRIEGGPESDDRVIWRVIDHGEGLADGILEEAFLPFRPQHRGRPGLGLAVARKLARAMGGDVALAPNPDGGAIATLTLPLHCSGE